MESNINIAQTKYFGKLVLLIWFTLFFQSILASEEYCNRETCPSKDPRLSYKVNMTDFPLLNVDIETLYTEIVSGSGYVIIPSAFSSADISHAREVILYLLSKQGDKASHFQGHKDAKANLQARVWNLLNKGRIWEKMVQHPIVVKLGTKILGDDLQLGSIATNTIFPGGSGQEPHVDYPYWDYYNKDHWPATPKVKGVHFFMNMQATVLLDDFTVENGATAVRPRTQYEASYPISEDFFQNYVQTTGKAGDLIVFVGLLHHCAMPNKSKNSRTGVLLQYLPKYVRPMEDLKRGVKKSVQARASPVLRKLLLLDYPYPSLLDEAEAVNSEGAESEFDWK